MKATFPIALICFALGFVTAWLMRSPSSGTTTSSTPSPSAQQGVTPQTTASKASQDSVAASRSARKPGAEAESEEAKSQAKAMTFDTQDTVKKMFEKKDKALLDKLARELNLSPEQLEKLSATLKARREKLATFDFNESDNTKEINDLLSSKALDEQVLAGLTEEQKTAFTEMRQKERQAKIDSNTLKSLGQVTEIVSLNDEQRAAVYNVLSTAETERWDKQQNSANYESMLMEGMGMESNDEFSLHSVMMDPELQEKMKDMGDSEETQKIVAQAMREALNKKIDAKVNLLAPILTPEQSTQYREQLLQKVDSMMGIMSNSEIIETE